MLILVEGVDKSGKSTFIEGLQKATGYAVFKNPFKPRDADRLTIGRVAGVYEGAYNMALSLDAFNVIFDRSHISETVYAPIKRDYYPSAFSCWPVIEKVLHGKALIFWVRTDREVIRKRLQQDQDEYLNMLDLEPVMSAYERWFSEECSLPLCQINGAQSRKKNVRAALKFIRKAQKQ